MKETELNKLSYDCPDSEGTEDTLGIKIIYKSFINGKFYDYENTKLCFLIFCVSLCLKLVELQNCKNDDKFPPYCAEPDGVTNKQSHG